mmetsp:Transcript_2867/g.4162  ORF Transcript_2867/g.4162 Transcript_2867/m.4162 type:complete len:137 (-) Transcript_2867:147-557(-)
MKGRKRRRKMRRSLVIDGCLRTRTGPRGPEDIHIYIYIYIEREREAKTKRERKREGEKRRQREREGRRGRQFSHKRRKLQLEKNERTTFETREKRLKGRVQWRGGSRKKEKRERRLFAGIFRMLGKRLSKEGSRNL